MNRHFTDARYYARRTAGELARAVRAELQPVEAKVRSLAGRRTHEPTRAERARARLRRASETVRHTVDVARSRVRGRRTD
jgi:hypothetical protein